MNIAVIGATVAVLGPVWAYVRAMARFRRAWQTLPPLPPLPAAPPALAVLIAARNEAANLPALLSDLAQQTYLSTATSLEVAVVDDHSTDDTAAVVRQAATQVPYTLRLLAMSEVAGQPTGKKAAIRAALAATSAPWVVLTDADCRVLPWWLAAHARVATRPTAHLASGPVLLTGSGPLAALQGVELAALVGVGAAGIGLGQPTMCNGANLSYRRATFAAVGGFDGNAHLASGDDEFLLHKIYAAHPQGVHFLRDPGAIVRTAAQPTVAALLAQRVRWSSKWKHYQHAAPQRLAVLVLLANLALTGGLLSLLLAPGFWPVVLAAWVSKLGADAWLLTPLLRFFDRRRWLGWLLPLQLAYAPYALATALLGLRGSYVWKGRAIK